MMSPQKTIYIREADSELWEKAQKLAGDSLPALVVQALRRYVEEEEGKPTEHEMENIEVNVFGADGRCITRRFVGKELVSKMESTGDTRVGKHLWSVAYSQRHRIVVWDDGDGSRDNRTIFAVYDTFPLAEEGGVPLDVLAAAASEIGDEYVQYLDI